MIFYFEPNYLELGEQLPLQCCGHRLESVAIEEIQDNKRAFGQEQCHVDE